MVCEWTKYQLESFEKKKTEFWVFWFGLLLICYVSLRKLNIIFNEGLTMYIFSSQYHWENGLNWFTLPWVHNFSKWKLNIILNEGLDFSWCCEEKRLSFIVFFIWVTADMPCGGVSMWKLKIQMKEWICVSLIHMIGEVGSWFYSYICIENIFGGKMK